MLGADERGFRLKIFRSTANFSLLSRGRKFSLRSDYLTLLKSGRGRALKTRIQGIFSGVLPKKSALRFPRPTNKV
ncbi:MAG: hypothetical protein DCC59_09640 [Chloroflexi bacterium]|nr:MAG: hypothetical protein DCC59_09640 [Chloroflexota bacterium]